MNQLISIAYEVFKSFDEGYQVRGVFLDRFQALIKYGTKISSLN